MKKINYSFLGLLIILLSSCAKTKQINITEDLLSNEIRFSVSETKDLTATINQVTYKVSNLERISMNDSFWYAFFHLDQKTQILLVYNLVQNTYDYCLFYPDSSHFFEDELICFSIKTEPLEFPLPKLYEITTLVKDYKNEIEKEIKEYSRFWTSQIDTVQDFYFREPFFYKDNNFTIPQNILSAIDKTYKENDTIYYVVWKQAGFPISSVYYYFNRKKVNSACAYPNEILSDNSDLPQSELVIYDKTKVSSQEKENNHICLSYYCSDNLQLSLIYNAEDASNYESYYIEIDNGQNKKRICLSDIFKYQDKLIKVELAESIDNYACFIITTKVFSYDLYINLSNYEAEVFLRASSFPKANRALE